LERFVPIQVHYGSKWDSLAECENSVVIQFVAFAKPVMTLLIFLGTAIAEHGLSECRSISS
jgi:hypothetical protein